MRWYVIHYFVYGFLSYVVFNFFFSALSVETSVDLFSSISLFRSWTCIYIFLLERVHDFSQMIITFTVFSQLLYLFLVCAVLVF